MPCEKQTERVMEILLKNGIKLTKGLSEKQIEDAENYYNIVFPQDLQELLMAFTPNSENFYNWSDYSHENVDKIKEALEWSIEGALFDVENNNFWWKTWGEKPNEMSERLRTARCFIEKAPKLIPIYGHRYISSYPNEPKNPIYSVYQTDIIFYGKDIWDYFEVEYGEKAHQDIDLNKIKPIPFWHDLIMFNYSR